MNDNFGFTALHISALRGCYELVKFFIDKGTDIYLKTEHGFNCLHIAALKGHLKLCTDLINKHNFDTHLIDNWGFTTLHCSVESGNYEFFTFFINNGADIYLKTENGLNCLHIAAESGHFELCKLLIDKNNFNVHATDSQRRLPLHFSATSGSYKLTKFFIDKETDIYLKTERGLNCLHIAALKGHLNLCKDLINKHNFDTHLTDNDGFTALHYSPKSGRYELIEFFIDKGIDVFLKTKMGLNCLHIAADNSHFKLCKLLIDEHSFDVHVTDSNGWSSLHFSARSGSYQLIKLFIEKGIDVYLKTKMGCNCLHIAASNGYLEICKLLIVKHKFDVHMTESNGRSSLHFSAQSGSYELFEFFADKAANFSYIKNIDLVSFGEDFRFRKALIDKPNVLLMTDNEGFNCLHIAALNGHLDLCRLLINKHNFGVNVTNRKGWTALHCSVQNGNIDLVNLFADMTTDVHLKTNDGMNCLHIATYYGHLNLCKTLINKHRFDVDLTENKGWSSLHFSVQNGSYELVNFFIDIGANLHLKTNNGENCLHIASFNGNLSLCKMFLESHEFDVHMSDNNECIPLHFSAKNGSFELFLYLLDKGSEVYCKTKDMENVLHLSAGNGHLKICEFDLKHFAKDCHNNNSKNQHVLYGNIYKSQIFYKYNTIFLHAMNVDGNTCLHLAANGISIKFAKCY